MQINANTFASVSVHFYLVDCISGENDVTKVATWVVPDFALLHKNSKHLSKKKTLKES